ncbi:DNA-binding protein [Evansella halocellulosilytica]|uniref:DNA-binding protein n=1 Tax=Evansella halocellulosilytica TaxID=2011013 RepID=UPI000BB6B651|nr:DNA-binding protein [Evansella halocellulosilytica]
MESGLFWVGLGLAALGYFISDGLKNFKNPKANTDEPPTLIKKEDLHIYLGLQKEEVKELLNKFPDAPKVELNGTSYFPYHHFIEWVSSKEIYIGNSNQERN